MYASYHHKLIPGTPFKVYQTFMTMSFSKSPLLKFLLSLRGIKNEESFKKKLTVLKDMPGKEVSWGLVAQPWTKSGGIVSGADYNTFKKPGYARIKWSFKFEPQGHETLVTTITEIKCTDEASRKKFAFYWFFIKPFSGLVRRLILSELHKEVSTAS